MFPDVMMFHEKSVLHNFYTGLIQHKKNECTYHFWHAKITL